MDIYQEGSSDLNTVILHAGGNGDTGMNSERKGFRKDEFEKKLESNLRTIPRIEETHKVEAAIQAMDGDINFTTEYTDRHKGKT